MAESFSVLQGLQGSPIKILFGYPKSLQRQNYRNYYREVAIIRTRETRSENKKEKPDKASV
jgi:hypothetical protein